MMLRQQQQCNNSSLGNVSAHLKRTSVEVMVTVLNGSKYECSRTKHTERTYINVYQLVQLATASAERLNGDYEKGMQTNIITIIDEIDFMSYTCVKLLFLSK